MSKELKLSAEYHKGRVNCSEVLSSVPEYRSKWYFSEKELEINSPSRMDGIDWKMENYIRRLYCSFIKKLGQELHVPQLTIATAIMFCHRFYMRQSLAKNDWQHLNVATATGMTEHESEAKRAHNHPLHPRHRRLFSLRQLNSLAVIIVLSASGMFALEDLSFFLFSLSYVLFLFRVVFPLPPSGCNLTDSCAFTVYASTSVVVGLLLPIVYIFHGILEGTRGDQSDNPACVPAGRTNVCGGGGGGRGLLSAREVLRADVLQLEEADRDLGVGAERGGEGEYSNARRLHIGWGLALLNLAFRSVNLFEILVPIYLPRAFKSYYGSKENPL